MLTPTDDLLRLFQAAFPEQNDRELIAAIIQYLETSNTSDGRQVVITQHDSTATVCIEGQTVHIDNLANNLYAIAQTCDRNGWYIEAERLLLSILALQERALVPDHSDIATILNDLAGILAVTKRMNQALVLMERAAAISEQWLGDQHPDTIIYRENRDFVRERLEEAGG